MAIITVSGKQIDLTGKSITFLDDRTQLNRVVIPLSVELNLVNNSVSFRLETYLLTPNGFKIGDSKDQTYYMDIKASSILGGGFDKPFANIVFQDALKPYGIEAKQIFDSTGKLNIIEK
jgi:hypothetical protein